jgi:Bacterial TSP3 repeat
MNLKYRSLLYVALATMGAAQAATVTLNTGDAVNTSSFNATGNWSNAAAPSSTNDYVVSVQSLRTPTGAFGGTFAGSSLTLNSGGAILYKGSGTASTITFNNLVLNGGLIRSGSGSGDRMILAGGISVTGTGSEIRADQSPYTINSILSGTGALLSSGGYGVTFTGTNTYTGDLTVSSTGSAQPTTLSSTNTWAFNVGANGVNNKILGTGYLSLAGTFNINLTSASTTIGDSWTLVSGSTLNESYVSTFTINGFTPTTGTAGTRTWVKNVGSIAYSYAESTGILSVVNNPDSDGDGLLDTWEVTYFGNITAQGASGDPDSDGYTNLQEYTAGSNPTLTASTPLDLNADGLADGHIFGTTDALGSSSFNSAGGWKDGLAPAAGGNYYVAINNFRTPADAVDYTFAGDHLVITTGGNLLFKGTGAITVPYLGLDGGLLNQGSTSAPVNLNGTINVTNLSEIWANNGSFNVNATISGTKDLKISNSGSGRSVTFTAADNTWTGSMNVTGEFILASTSKLNFKPTISGTTNAVTGTGIATFNGAFDIDLSSAATAIGSSWTLVAASTLNENYDAAFTVTGFTPDGSTQGYRIWTKVVGSSYYQFNESTGILVVNNPDTDGDGLADAWEMTNFGSLEFTGLDDPDGDGANNEQEETAGTNPNSATSWPDADADGLKDAWEVQSFGSITAQNASGDPDGDLATNLQEFQASSDPLTADNYPDSDSDGMNDAWELQYFGNLSHDGTADSDGDGYTDAEEHAAHTNPTSNNSSPIKATMLHRWSFNGNLTDTVGSSNATIIDVGANNTTYNDTVTPTKITMTGGARATSDYIKLGSNLVPKNTEPFTLELWAKQESVQSWSRIFDFNNDTTEYLMMSWTTGTNAATDRLDFVDKVQSSTALAGTGYTSDNKNQWGTANEYHIILEVKPLAGSGGMTQVKVYSAPSTATTMGAAKTSGETKINLVNFNDALDALGYSAWTADSTANATYNEVRMWSGTLTPYVRDLLQTQGPDNAAITDTDADSLPDSWELQYASNLTTLTQTGDNDGDGYSNRDEYIAGSNPLSTASTPLDTDADGLADAWEITYFGNITAQNGSGDPDNDGFTNEQEETLGTDPTSGDNDGDGLLDSWEITYFGSTTAQGTDGDPDGDSYSNYAEFTAGSNPTVASSIPGDIDGDGLADTWETTYFASLAAQDGSGDPDSDGYTNEQEETAGSNPTVTASTPSDINADGITDGHLLIATDAFGTTSFNAGTNWNDTQAPSAGNNYLAYKQNLRTPDDATAYTFAGDKLVMSNDGTANLGVLLIKGTGVITIPYLGLDGGEIRNATSGNVSCTIEGTINVSKASTLFPNNSNIVINSVISGSKNLSITAAGTNTVTFNANNTWTGSLNVPGSFILGTTGTQKFTPTTNGTTNAVTGAGTAVFNGTFNIDLTNASTTQNDSWTLVSASTLTETYGSTFAITGFTADTATAGSRKWTSASGAYQFDEATGVLTRITGAGNDSDSDGMDDTWEQTYFGGLSQPATGDYDGDGTDNLTEYRLGLIPNNGNSRFAATLTGGNQLSWPSATGLTFTVKRSTTLETGSWTTIGTVTGTAGTASFTDPSPPAGKAFYTVTLEP